MKAATQNEGRRKLQQIRDRHERAGAEWTLAADDEGLALVVRAADAPDIDKVAVFVPNVRHDLQDFAIHSHDDLGFVLRQLFRATDRLEQIYTRHPEERPAPPPKPPNHARDCSIHCGLQAFRRFLIEHHDLQDATDNERVANHVRQMLDVKSRSDLDVDKAAGDRWLDFKRQFETWKKVS
jgi:hypothetical protein